MKRLTRLGTADRSQCTAAEFPLAALRMQWRRKQRVSPAHQPVGDEADPLLRGRVELVKGRGASNVLGE
jgi:hypothetical protein